MTSPISSGGKTPQTPPKQPATGTSPEPKPKTPASTTTTSPKTPAAGTTNTGSTPAQTATQKADAELARLKADPAVGRFLAGTSKDGVTHDNAIRFLNMAGGIKDLTAAPGTVGTDKVQTLAGQIQKGGFTHPDLTPEQLGQMRTMAELTQNPKFKFVAELDGQPGLSEKDIIYAEMRDGKFETLSAQDLEAPAETGIAQGDTKNAPEGSLMAQLQKGTATPESYAKLEADGFLVPKMIQELKGLNFPQDPKKLAAIQHNAGILLGNAGILDSQGNPNGLADFLQREGKTPLGQIVLTQLKQAWGIDTATNQNAYKDDPTSGKEAQAIEALLRKNGL